jgi:pseudouridine-5'-monophosphatase
MAVHQRVTHCIFDMDGLLLNTESFYTDVQRDLVKQYGKEHTWELKSKMMGMKALDACRYLVATLDIGDQVTPEEFLEKRETALDALFPTCVLMPGVEKLLRHLSACKVPFCLATSSHKRHYELKTTNHKPMFELFSHRITGDQVSVGKPAPDIFLKAAAEFDPPASPSDCLVFEDAPAGVASAVAAGMPVVMVPHPSLGKELTKDATVVLPSLEDFDPAAWGLPPYTS